MKFTREALGLVVREHREAMDPRLTQEQLGTDAGYKAGAAVSISRIENGLSHPGPERFAGIARALGLTPGQLEAEASQRTAAIAKAQAEKPYGTGIVDSDESVSDRAKRIQQEIDHRTSVITELGNAFNEAHERARDNFLVRFVQIASGVTGAPQPDKDDLLDDGKEDPASQANYRMKVTTYGVAHYFAGGLGAGTAGAAVGGAAAYGAFMAAVSFGSASTGATISGLSGVAATNAALALLGGGTLAAGGAGMAGGTALLAGLVAAPAVILAVGGLVWMIKRSRKQQRELIEKLNAAEADLEATHRGFVALADILPRATATLSYVAVHGGHALERWERRLGSLPVDWDALNDDDQKRYQQFIAISASQLSVGSIDVQNLMLSRGTDREHLIELADKILTKAHSKVEACV